MLKRTEPKLLLEDLVNGLKAAGEPTRLRILALLAEAELTVKDLTVILGQSQPRVSRHLKLMAEAGLIHRYPEGAWVYYRAADRGGTGRIVKQLTALVDDADDVRRRDLERLDELRDSLAARAQGYFAANASAWDELRTLHVPEEAVEETMLSLVQDREIDTLVDIGTGTGRLLELFAAHCERAIGIDLNSEMLALARAKIAESKITHAQVRRADLFSLDLPSEGADFVTIHQVLHYLSDPGRAIREASRLLRQGGGMLIADFAPHDIEILRNEHAHTRLGFSHEQVSEWLSQSGLSVQQIVDLPPQTEAASRGLTVTLWLAERMSGRIAAAHAPALASQPTDIDGV